MTDAEIKNLRDLMRAATPGPLTVMARHHGEQCVAVVNKLELVPPNSVELAHEKADADFIAAAVNALPGLLDEVERLRADAARYRWMRDRKACPFAETDPAWDDLDAAIDAQMRGESEA